MVFWITKKGLGTQAVAVDDEDWPRVQNYTWYIRREKPNLDLRVFTRIPADGLKHTTELRLDQFILGIEKMPRLADIIHKDDNLLNCRKENLLFIGQTPEQWREIRKRKAARRKNAL